MKYQNKMLINGQFVKDLGIYEVKHDYFFLVELKMEV